MLTLQLCLDGVWHDAAMLNVKAPQPGRGSEALLAYDFTYAIVQLASDCTTSELSGL